VADVVAATPAITIQRSGSGFEPATLRVRGSTAEQVLILRDGRPLNDAAGTIVDLSRISLHDVQRIEIIRGAATAITGHGGAAGAINLITAGENGAGSTLDGDPLTGSSRVALGSFREVRLDGSVDMRPTATTTLGVDVAGVLSDNRYDYERAGGGETRINGGGREGSLAVTLDVPVGGPDPAVNRPRLASSIRVGASDRARPPGQRRVSLRDGAPRRLIPRRLDHPHHRPGESRPVGGGSGRAGFGPGTPLQGSRLSPRGDRFPSAPVPGNGGCHPPMEAGSGGAHRGGDGDAG